MESVVYDKPEVKLDAVEAVGSDKIFFNWSLTYKYSSSSS
jgi:hypothetical protein